MAVELLTESAPEIVEAMECLIPQLSRSTKPLDAQACERFVSQLDVHLLIYRPDIADARGKHPILDMPPFVIFEIPTSVRAWIEDIIVDEAAHGQGAGLKLVEAAFEQVEKVDAETVDLTSHPSHEAMNHLYRRASFEQREANTYRVPLD